MSGLTQTQAYHWCVRLLYHNGNRSGQVASRWIHIPWNGWNEQDFRSRATMAIRTTVITYTYDPLYRLIGANYSGVYTYTFAYDYDKVGNREAFTRSITNTIATTYTFDAANRLATQNGQSLFAWDNNGNLLTDGNAVYAYDFANRLISTTIASANTQFGYNGNGARLRLIESGVATTYTQDLAIGLPVVLQAKTGSATMQYIYSMGTRPLAEYDGAWEYLLADGLGSVRQIADANGDVTLAKSYQPYGEVLNSAGTATSMFGYTGEQIDATGLVFLRARYMQPSLGLFLSRDLWQGDFMKPRSINGWNYVEGNPIIFIDPTGNIPLPPFGSEHSEYSCNCGWIDWTHATPDHSTNVMNGIREAQGRQDPYAPPGVSYVHLDFPDGRFPIVGVGGGLEGTIRVSTNIDANSPVIWRVSLGIYMSAQNAFERYQGGEQSWLRGMIGQSSFSEEDLMSDLIGYYLALYNLRDGKEIDLTKEMIREKCGVVGLYDDPATYQSKQLEVYHQSGITNWRQLPPDPFGQVHRWFDPKFHCSNDCADEPQRIPSMLLEISPIGPGSLWSWYLARAYILPDQPLLYASWPLDTSKLNAEVLDQPNEAQYAHH